MVVVALLVAAATLGGAVSWIVVIGALFIVASIFITRLAIRESRKPSLFGVDRRQPLRPLQLDQDARNKVLRQNFKPELIPDNLDAIVVGSGMGGLTTAALMAMAGKKVGVCFCSRVCIGVRVMTLKPIIKKVFLEVWLVEQHFQRECLLKSSKKH